MTVEKFNINIWRYFGLGLIALCLANCQQEINTNATQKIVQKKQQIPDKIDFNFHVKPILSDRCFACHGPDKNAIEGDLSLATREDALIALGKHKNRFAILNSL